MLSVKMFTVFRSFLKNECSMSTLIRLNNSSHNLVHADDVVSESSEQGRSISGPAEGRAIGELSALSGGGREANLSDDNLRLEVPDDDASRGTSAQPVSVRREDEGVDDSVSLEGVQVFALIQIPQHGLLVLSSRGAQGSIRGNSHSVQVASVLLQRLSELAVAEVPHLDGLVPSAGDDQGSGGAGREADAGNPVRVSLVGDSELALAQSVPELDRLVPRAGNDLAVVSREGDRQNLLGVSNKAALSLSGLDVPEAEGSVPRGTQAELAIRRDDDILNEVRVSDQGLDGKAVVALLAGELPDKDGLVTRGREQKLRVLRGGGKGSDPAGVAEKLSTLLEAHSIFVWPC